MSTMSRAMIDAVFASDRSAVAYTIPSAETRQSAQPWAWLAAIEGFWNSSDREKAHGSTAEAVDKVLAQYRL